jgi:hypothetical protein
MLRKDYNRKGSVEKISGRVSQGAWGQDELTCDNSRKVTLTSSYGRVS